MASRPQTRSPQDTNNQIDDNSLSYAIVAASPQYIDGHSVPSTDTVDSFSSPYTTPSILHNAHVHLDELSSPPVSNNPQAYSPSSASNPQAYSPSTYLPPPSPTPSQKYSYSPPEEYQYYSQGNDASQQHQYMYQQTYQQEQQQQAFTEPILNSYPEPTLVDINDKHISTTLPPPASPTTVVGKNSSGSGPQ